MASEWRRPLGEAWGECVDSKCHSVQAGIPHYADPVHMETLAEIRAWRELEYPGHSHLPAGGGTVRGGRTGDRTMRAKTRGEKRVLVMVCLAAIGFVGGSCLVAYLTYKILGG